MQKVKQVEKCVDMQVPLKGFEHSIAVFEREKIFSCLRTHGCSDGPRLLLLLRHAVT
jgi:hypothetical protein